MATPSFEQQRKLPQMFLYTDQARYFMALDKFYKLTNRHELCKQQMEKDFDLHVMKALPGRIGDALNGQPLHVLGVGSNEGKKQLTANTTKQRQIIIIIYSRFSLVIRGKKCLLSFPN